jgi:serine/threonine protein kinase
MAEVWAARVEGPGGFVKSLALKFILESFTGDAELERLFVNEARVAARLQHANLVSVFDFDRMMTDDQSSGSSARYYIAMERVDGHDLRRVLQVARHRGRRIAAGVALHVAGEVLKGLRYVHEWREEGALRSLGLVHRDVSPHNVLVGMGGEVKLSDFGIAKAASQSLGTQSGMIRGKLAYASPEQLRSEPIDHRADQFGLGVTLWELLADRKLFDGTSEAEIVAKVLRCEIPPLQNRGIEPAVDQLVRRMLSSRPGDRFPSTAEAVAALMAVPGYLPDATVLVELMRELFAAPVVVVPPTVPLNLADPPSVASLAETSRLERSPREGAATFTTAVASTVTPSVGSGAQTYRPPSGDGGTTSKSVVAAEASPSEAIPVPVDPTEAVTGSAYVSDDSSVMPQSFGGSGLPRPRRRLVGALAFGVILAGGGFALVMNRADLAVDDPEPADLPDSSRSAGAGPAHGPTAARTERAAVPTSGAAPEDLPSRRPSPTTVGEEGTTEHRVTAAIQPALPPAQVALPAPVAAPPVQAVGSPKLDEPVEEDSIESTGTSANRSRRPSRRKPASMPVDSQGGDTTATSSPRARDRVPIKEDNPRTSPSSKDAVPNGAPILE